MVRKRVAWWYQRRTDFLIRPRFEDGLGRIMKFVLRNHATVTADQPPPAAPRRKLRWYQYSLRTLMLVVLLASIGMSYVAVTIQRQRRQGEAARAIEKAGGKVESERTWLGRLLRDDSLVRVTEVELGRETTDAGLVRLQGLRQLQWLVLSNTRVSDAGLVHLQGLRQLQGLWLANTQVSDSGVVHLQGLRQLYQLDLANTKVTSQGVKKLRQALPHCRIHAVNLSP